MHIKPMKFYVFNVIFIRSLHTWFLYIIVYYCRTLHSPVLTNRDRTGPDQTAVNQFWFLYFLYSTVQMSSIRSLNWVKFFFFFGIANVIEIVRSFNLVYYKNLICSGLSSVWYWIKIYTTLFSLEINTLKYK